MKNMKYFPFERNHYFYGKLLTVDDFETEQRYMNDKRRVINRFLYGSGVVCGLNVVTIDDTTISVEPGLALDFSGREVVVDVPSVKKLSMIEGFDSFLKDGNNKQYLYLCLDYKEIEKEQVHNVTGSGSVNYNRFQEGYHLSITDREPTAANLSNSGFYENTRKVYSGNGIQISQKAPHYVESGGELEVKIIIENMGQVQPIRFHYDLDLVCLEYGGSHVVHVDFNEPDYEEHYRYEQTYRLKAISIKDAAGTMELKRESFELYIGERQVEAGAGLKMSAQIISGSIQDEVRNHYYRSAMEDIVKNNYQQSIYLAKIFVIRAGDSYVIDFTEQMPFHQYVYNNVLADIMDQLEIQEKQKLLNQEHRQEVMPEQGGGPEAVLPEIKTGYAMLDLGIGGSTGQRFFTEDITHDLGLGNVTVMLGQCCGTSDEHEVIYGSPEVFEDEVPFRAELAAKTNTASGTFQIGLRLVEPTMIRYVRVNWTAIRDPRERIHEMEEMSMFIKPEILYLKTRESYYLEAKFQGIEPTQVKWAVREEHGGTIEQNGKYTAPNMPGIYEVMASSMIYDKLCASIFIVVREIGI